MNFDPEHPTPRWKWPVAIVAALVLLVGGVAGGVKFYRKWQPERLARQGREFLEKGDYRSASLSAQRALQINNRDIPSTRLMAELYEKSNAPDAVLWRKRVVELQPGVTKDIFAWAADALRFGQPAIAAQALSTVPESDRRSADYHKFAGAAAIGMGKLKEAETHFAEAVKLDPRNELCQYNYATLQVQSSKADVRAAGEKTLERLCASETYHTVARRSLVSYLVSTNRLADALPRAREQQADPAAAFRDRIAYLDILRGTNSSEFAPYLEKVRADSAAKADDAAALIGWMRANGMMAGAIDWAKDFPPEMLSTPQVGRALAECHLANKDWPALQALLKGANWRAIEYLRLTLLARALKEQGDANGFRAQWGAACSAAMKRRDVTKQLIQLATDWGWEDQARELCWEVARDPAAPRWAIDLLYRHYQAKRDTRGLFQVASRLVELEPANDAARNNLAMFSLLLKTNVDRAFGIARELYAKDPANPSYVSTYAYALHLRGKSDEALRIMSSLTMQQLEDPATAAYYGVLLAANGAPKDAAKFLELAKKGNLLPEEKELVNGAAQNL
jgi:predicted Zn-dependent protease